MAQWAVLIGAERLAAERLFHHDTLEVSDPPAYGARPVPGEEVLVVAPEPELAVVALGRFAGPGDTDGEPLVIAYTRRFFDDPQPAEGLALGGALSPVDAAAFQSLAGRLKPARDLSTWLVSVDLPIEADSPAEAVRRFWSYVRELGPRELPAFVSPSGDELAMQAYVLGEQANLDPEEDD